MSSADGTDADDWHPPLVVTDMYKLDLKGIVVLGKLEAGSGIPFGLPFQPKFWKYAHETVRSVPK